MNVGVVAGVGFDGRGGGTHHIKNHSAISESVAGGSQDAAVGAANMPPPPRLLPPPSLPYLTRFGDRAWCERGTASLDRRPAAAIAGKMRCEREATARKKMLEFYIRRNSI